MPNNEVMIQKYQVSVPRIDVSRVGGCRVPENTARGDTYFTFSIPCIGIQLLQTCVHWFELQYSRHIRPWHRESTLLDQKLRDEMFVCMCLHMI